MAHLLRIVRLSGDLPVRLDFHFDYRVLAYAAVVTTVTAWLIGLIAKQAGSARFAFDASAILLGVAVILWLFFRHLASRSPFIEKAQAVG